MFLKHLFLYFILWTNHLLVFTFVLSIVLFCSLLPLQQLLSLSSLGFGSLSLDCVWCSFAYAIAVVQGSLMAILDWLMLFLSFSLSSLPLQQCKILFYLSFFFSPRGLLYMIQYFGTFSSNFKFWFSVLGALFCTRVRGSFTASQQGHWTM